MRRSDTPFLIAWVARLGTPALLGLAMAVAEGACAQAQILGEQAPGQPGLIQGEMRTRYPAPAQPPMPAYRPAEADIDPQASPNKFGLRRTPNTTVKRQFGSGQTRASGYAGASPGGSSQPPVITQEPRTPARLTATRPMNAPRPASMAAQPRPTLAQQASPGINAPLPQQQRRPLPEDDPYAPLGLRTGGMTFKPGIEASGGYDTNPARTPGPNHKGSAFWRTEGTLDAASDWSAHRLDVALRGAYTGYTSINNSNRPDADARIALRLDATRDLTIETGLTAHADSENTNSINLPGGAIKRTPFYSYGGTLGATQRFGNASLNLRSSIDRFTFDDVITTTGPRAQTARNYTAYGLRLRGGYEITPGITPFVEASMDRRVHDLRLDANGFARDSTGTVARAGTSFELARSLTGEVSAGYTIRAYEDARLMSLKAPLVDGQLTWSISPLTTLNLRAQSDIAETTVAGSSGARTYRASATLTHAFLRNFTAAATLGLTKSDYNNITRQENGVTGGLKLEYKINRLIALRGSYAYELFHVNTAGENYHSHTFMAGIKLTP